MVQDEPDGVRRAQEVYDDVMSAPGPPEVRKDRRVHGGTPPRVDDEELVERTEHERADLGLEPYDELAVPPATDDPVPVDVTETEEYRQEVEEVDREVREGLLPSGEKPDFPPSRYPDR
jgi:hypothetical protein